MYFILTILPSTMQEWVAKKMIIINNLRGRSTNLSPLFLKLTNS